MIRYEEAKIDRNLHVGGYPACSVCIECLSGMRWLYKSDIDPCHAINLARSVWKNRFDLFDFTVEKVHVVNQKTGTARDTIQESEG